jgi:HPt (histidine-containing phosphotransfer) domain-containing protein
MHTVHWDQRKALQRVDGDTELLFDLVEMFYEEYPDQLCCLMQSLAQRDFAAVRKAAHTLKGSLGYLGACEGEQLAAAIERASQSADAAGVRLLVSDLAAYVEGLREVMRTPDGEFNGAAGQC